MTYLKSSIQKTHFLSTAFGSMLGYRRKKRNDVMMWNGPRDELYYFFHLSPVTIIIPKLIIASKNNIVYFTSLWLKWMMILFWIVSFWGGSRTTPTTSEISLKLQRQHNKIVWLLEKLSVKYPIRDCIFLLHSASWFFRKPCTTLSTNRMQN